MWYLFATTSKLMAGLSWNFQYEFMLWQNRFEAIDWGCSSPGRGIVNFTALKYFFNLFFSIDWQRTTSLKTYLIFTTQNFTKSTTTLPLTCQSTLSINMSCDQSRCRVDTSREIFFCRSTCQTGRHSVGSQQRMSIDWLQCGRMSVDIDSVDLDKHWKNLFAFYFDSDKFSI